MKLLSILGISVITLMVFGILIVDALGFSALYHQRVSEVLNIGLYISGFVGLVALRRKLIK
jgi:hypothetical protein